VKVLSNENKNNKQEKKTGVAPRKADVKGGSQADLYDATPDLDRDRDNTPSSNENEITKLIAHQEEQTRMLDNYQRKRKFVSRYNKGKNSISRRKHFKLIPDYILNKIIKIETYRIFQNPTYKKNITEFTQSDINTRIYDTDLVKSVMECVKISGEAKRAIIQFEYCDLDFIATISENHDIAASNYPDLVYFIEKEYDNFARGGKEQTITAGIIYEKVRAKLATLKYLKQIVQSNIKELKEVLETQSKYGNPESNTGNAAGVNEPGGTTLYGKPAMTKGDNKGSRRVKKASDSENLIWWKGTEPQLIRLFDLLNLNGVIDKTTYTKRDDVIRVHFKDAAGNRFNKKLPGDSDPENLIWWKRSGPLLTYLFDLLYKFDFIDVTTYNIRHAIARDHFKDANGKRFDNKRLGDSASKKGEKTPRGEKEIAHIIAELKT